MKVNSLERPVSRTGIKSKLIRVLVLQLLFISLVTALGVYAAAKVVEKVMIGTALENEATHYWQQRALDPTHPLPNTDNLRGYSTDVEGADFIPAVLQTAPIGQSRAEFEDRHPIIYVEEREGHKLLLVFDEQSVRALSFWFGVVPLSLALIVIYISAWFVYRQSSKTLSPLMSLAQTMGQFDLTRHRLDSLNFKAWSGPKVDDEVRVLADSLEAFTLQLQTQLERERAFSRDVSHELRTPLAVIRGSLELLQKQGQLSEQQNKVVERMQATSRDMQSLIEILLVLAKEEHRGREENEQTDVTSLAERLLAEIEQSHNADQHVKLLLQSESDLVVNAPPQVVGMVIANLLRNACNYCPSGEVVARVSREGVCVSDTGAGIPASELSRLQQPFQRDVQSSSGYGLGLDIVRRLCDRYNWTLSIESSQGQGTRVAVKMQP